MALPVPTMPSQMPIDEDLGLFFPLEKLSGSEAPRNKEVLLHLFYELKKDGLQVKVESAVRKVAESIRLSW